MAATPLNPHAEKWAHLKPNQHCTLEIDKDGNHCWVNAQGKDHRVDKNGVQDGPSGIFADGYLDWHFNGLCHRLEGPARISPSWGLQWWLDGEKLTQEKWARDIRVIEVNSRTQEGAEEWLKQL